MDLTAGQDELMQYWGTIRNAVNGFAGTADIWQAVRDTAAAQGEALQVADAVDLGKLRSTAVALRDAAAALASAAPDTPLVPSTFLPEAPWARDVESQRLAPSWQINYQATVIRDGETVQIWRTDFQDLTLPTTVGDLFSTIQDSAGIASDIHGETLVSVDSIEGMSV